MEKKKQEEKSNTKQDSIIETNNKSKESSKEKINNIPNTKVNINTATQAQLETLPGIGESTALKIINYRKEKGKFSKIEDIKKVTGIGESKYNKLKNLITV